MGTRRVGRLLASGSAVAILFPLLLTPPSGAVTAPARQRAQEAQEIRTVWTREFGIPRPTGLTYDPRTGELLVAQARRGRTKVLRLGLSEDPRGVFRLPGVEDPSTLAFDPLGGRLTAVSGGEQISAGGPRLGRLSRTDISGLGLRAPAGATFDPSTGTWYLLDQAALAVLRVPAAGFGSATRIPLRDLGVARLGGIALDPSDGLLYVSDPGRELLFGLDGTGSVRRTYDLGELDLRSPGAMTFAPSADTTDDPATTHLYVADAGDRSWFGGVMEVSLAPTVVALAQTVTATLVQVIDTSAWNPASPDPAGITYVPSTDHLMIADSEVDETTGAGFHGVNLWRSTRTGSVVDTGDLTPWTREPTGLGYDAATDTLFVSTDSGNRIFVIKPGNDGRFGTSDDVVSSFSTGVGDTEDPEFDPATGHLFFVDGVSTEVYRIDPVDGVFGNGNDVVTHFDVGVHGATDTEGLGSDQARGTLLVGDRGQRKIYEVTKTGDLVRIIDASGIPGMRFISGLTMAPASNGSGAMNYWIVDRAVDNGPDPNENDGKIFEIAVPSSGDLPPTVQITSPAAGATVSGTVQIQASASDDQGVTQVEFRIDGALLSTDTTAPYQASWNTTTVGDGPHTITAIATDTASQTASDSNGVTVDNNPVDDPPTVQITSPAEGATVSGTVQIEASASDDQGVTQVELRIDGALLSTDTTAPYQASWNTTTVGDGPHTITAIATDTANQTASDSNGVTVDNNPVDDPPTVQVTSPAEGATVSGTVQIEASASDDQGVTQVELRIDGALLSTDTTAPYQASWNTTTVGDGPHTITAIATDTASQTASDSNGVTVDNTAPTVQVASPSSGATVSGTIAITASASDASGVASVRFFVDAAPIGTDTDGSDGWSVVWNTTSVGNGAHDLTARATDAAGNATTSAAVQVTVDNPLVLDIAIAASLDDVEERSNGSVNATSSDLELMLDGSNLQRAVGLRYTGVGVPQGAAVTGAYVQFQVDEASTDATDLLVRGQAADDAPAFSTSSFNVTNRPMTTASVPWAPPAWPTVGARGPDQRTPDLAPVLEEIFARPGWAAGNALVLIVTGSGRRIAEAFDGTFAPVLHIEYGVGDAKPTVQVTSPADGATVSGTVQIEASASDDQGITQVQFRIDGATLSTDTTAPYQASWNTTAVGDGPHTITAVATDTANQSTTSAAIGVTVDNVDDPPTVQVTVPAAGAKVAGTVQIQASASDDIGVTQVQFFDGSTSIGTDTDGSNGWSVSWDTTAVADGAHSLTARATDTANQSTTSAAVGVTVDNTPPSVQITSPAPGATVSGTIAITASASDASGVGSVMLMLDGSTVLGTDTDGSDGWSVVWNTTSAGNGNHQLTAVAADIAGNSATSAAIQVTVDNPLVLDIAISASMDDVEERTTGGLYTNSSDLDLMDDGRGDQRAVGLRFVGINVPQGATIVDAYVQFQADKTSSVATSLAIHGEAADSAPAFVKRTFDVTSRPTTTASVAWSPPAWTTVGARGPDQRTPQLEPVLEEIFARPGWLAGNAIVLIITGTGARIAEAFDGTFAPVLHIEYAIP